MIEVIIATAVTAQAEKVNIARITPITHITIHTISNTNSVTITY